jgi:hypothetical protein
MWHLFLGLSGFLLDLLGTFDAMSDMKDIRGRYYPFLIAQNTGDRDNPLVTPTFGAAVSEAARHDIDARVLRDEVPLGLD